MSNEKRKDKGKGRGAARPLPEEDGSRPLRNHRHELFCQHYTGDKRRNAVAAYVAAGYKDTPSARADASRLLTYANVRARVAHLNDEALETVRLHAREAVGRLAAIATATYGDYLDENGHVDPAKVKDPVLGQAVEYCQPIYNGEGVLVGHRLKLYDATRAIELLGLAAAPSESQQQVLVVRVGP